MVAAYSWRPVPDHLVYELQPLRDLQDVERYSNRYFAVCVKGMWYFVPPPKLNRRMIEWFKFPSRRPFKQGGYRYTYIHFPLLNLEKLRVTGLEMPRGPVVGPR